MDLETADRSLREGGREIERIADGEGGVAGLQVGRVAQGKKWIAGGGNAEHGQSAARIVAEDAGVELQAVDRDAGGEVVADDGRGGEDGALVIDDEPGAGGEQAVAARLDADDGGLGLVEKRGGVVAGGRKIIRAQRGEGGPGREGRKQKQKRPPRESPKTQPSRHRPHEGWTG